MTVTTALRAAGERYAAAFDRLSEKHPDAAEDLNELDLAVSDWLVEKEDDAVVRHGRQIAAMIQGELYRPSGCAAPNPREGSATED